MKADNIIQWLMPREDRFRSLFAEDTQNLVRGARLFAEIAQSQSLEERRVKVVALKAVEHEGDRVTRQVFEILNSTFITPLDREDIRAIASHLDDILDLIDEVAQFLVLFELSEAPEPLRQFAGILVDMVAEIDKALAKVWDMRRAKDIQQALVRLSDLENQADELYNTVIADLFRAGRNPVEILKWKEVYDGLEDACDRCKDYSHILGNLVIKHA